MRQGSRRVASRAPPVRIGWRLEKGDGDWVRQGRLVIVRRCYSARGSTAMCRPCHLGHRYRTIHPTLLTLAKVHIETGTHFAT